MNTLPLQFRLKKHHFPPGRALKKWQILIQFLQA